MPNYEDFKKYGEMEKKRKAEPAAPAPVPEKPKSGVKKLFGKFKGDIKN